MKNKILCIVLLFTVLFLSGCEADVNEEITTDYNSEDISVDSESKVIEQQDFYSITYNGDFSYSYEICDKNGKQILSETLLHTEPRIEKVDENIYKCMTQWGTGITTQKNVYVNVASGAVSEAFNAVYDEFDGKTVYYAFRDSKHIMVIQDIFDKDAYYKEFELNDDIYVVADAVTDAEVSSDGRTLTVKYLAGKAYVETETNFTIK